MPRHFQLGTLVLFLLAAAAYAQDVPTPGEESSLTAPLQTMQLEDGDSIVFLGDSITHQCLYTQYVEDYLYTRFPTKRFRIHNAGVGGAQAWDALQRFEADVAKYEPKYVTVLLGMNDGRYRPYDEEIFQTYRRDMSAVVEKIKATGATPVLMTPTMYDARAAMARRRNQVQPAAQQRWELYNSVLAYYGNWLRHVATESGYGFVDMYSPLNNITLRMRKSEPKFTIIADSVHPGPQGQLVMAIAILDNMGMRKQVSSIRLNRNQHGRWVPRVSNGEIADIAETETGVAFSFTANALPWVVPAEARDIAREAKMQALTRETISIQGLDLGAYELRIDEEFVGVYYAGALGRQVELQFNARTPQYQQAAEVAALNKQRNDGPVKALRQEWSIFQRYARLKRALEEQPDNARAKENYAKVVAQMEGRDERIKNVEAAAKAIEDQIFEKNKPQTHSYEVTKVQVSQVSGLVTLDGQPLEGGKIGLQSDTGRVATATTNNDGQFVVRTGGVRGAIRDTYRVTVKHEAVPKAYGDAEASPLAFEVIRGSNELNLELASSNE